MACKRTGAPAIVHKNELQITLVAVVVGVGRRRWIGGRLRGGCRSLTRRQLLLLLLVQLRCSCGRSRLNQQHLLQCLSHCLVTAAPSKVTGLTLT